MDKAYQRKRDPLNFDFERYDRILRVCRVGGLFSISVDSVVVLEWFWVCEMKIGDFVNVVVDIFGVGRWGLLDPLI